MIKIVAGTSVPAGSTIAFINLCNQLNARGHDCIFYGPDRWHLDKCKSATASDFSPVGGDTIVLHGVDIHSIADLDHIQSSIERQRDPQRGLDSFKGLFLKLFSDAKKANGFKLILSCQETDRFPLKRTNYLLSEKIQYSHATQLMYHKVEHEYFICPNFCDPLVPSPSKPGKAAAVIGSIRKDNRIEVAIENALQNGMETVTLFGYLYDPIYFYSQIEPLTKKYPGRIRYAGFVEDRQKIYDSISDVFCAVSKPWSLVGRECDMTGTRFHGWDRFEGEFMSNDGIYAIWKDQLGL